jgi:putative transposase
MKGKRHKTEGIIRILRMDDGGKTVEEVCREVNICDQTFYRWRRKYGRMEMADAKRYKELENENSELKKMLVDEMLKARVLENYSSPTPRSKANKTSISTPDLWRVESNMIIQPSTQQSESTLGQV